MSSRWLQALDARINAAEGPVPKACLRAQRALYLARQGQREEAAAIVQALREEFRSRPNAELTAWISLAEALIQFFTRPGPEATDRLKRAQALGRAIGHAELVPLCSAWLAHLEFNASRMEPMIEHAAQALALAQPQHHAALARAKLVVADAYHYAGRFDLAKPWYAAVRDHALAEGDEAMISAMLHNVAAFRANHVRVSAVFQSIDLYQAKRALLETESTKNYDAGIGTASLGLFVPLLRAQLFTVLERYEEAAALFQTHVEQTPSQGMSRLLPSYLGDLAWCLLRLRRQPEAVEVVRRAIDQPTEDSDPDDLATAFARIAAVLVELGEVEHAAGYEASAQEQLLRHRAAQAHLFEQLERRKLVLL